MAMSAPQRPVRLRTAPDLRPFIIPETCVSLTGRQLGVGSYGSVEEVEVHGMICAGKKIHEALVQNDGSGTENVVRRKYVEECRLLAELRHPRIVKFLGLHFARDSALPILLMEKLHTSLDDVLTKYDQGDPQNPKPVIPLDVKVPILRDVAKGLWYLHTRTPKAVVHRDLSAKNVLLDADNNAKISDLGNSLLIFPCDLLAVAYLDDDYLKSTGRKRWLARTEVERREQYIARLRQSLGIHHSLVRLVESCLDNDAEDRPSADGVLRCLEEVQVDSQYQNIVKLEIVCDLAAQKLEMYALNQVKEDVIALKQDLECKEREIAALREELTSARREAAKAKQQPTAEGASPGSTSTVSEQVEPGEFLSMSLTQAGGDHHSPQLVARKTPAQKKTMWHKLFSSKPAKGSTQPTKAEEEPHREVHKKVTDEWEIDRRQITLIQKLGEGRFGEVWKGLWNVDGGTPVAVKTLKPGAMTVNELIHEATLMKKLRHPKLLQLYAVCTNKEPIYIITELMKHGTLLMYLRGEGRLLKLPHLIDMTAQVAAGMVYLEEQNCIHRELTARNILVGEHLVCKITEFGMAQVVDEGIYEAHPGTKFPIKWTAPEAAMYNRITIKSDVWSFGIVLYEVITYGHCPYPGMTNAQVLEALQQGYRMPRPLGCPDKLYDIMLDCWREEPASRPTFETLQWQLEEFFTTDVVYGEVGFKLH